MKDVFDQPKNTLILKNGPIPGSFSVYFRLIIMSQLKFKFKLIKAYMVGIGIQTWGGRMEG